MKIEPVRLPIEAAHPGLQPFAEQEEIRTREAELARAEEDIVAAERALKRARLLEQEAIAQLPPGRTLPPVIANTIARAREDRLDAQALECVCEHEAPPCGCLPAASSAR